jgi:hypothetical protein
VAHAAAKWKEFVGTQPPAEKPVGIEPFGVGPDINGMGR